MNPVLIIEVPSDSTEGYDRGTKFEFYRGISTFKEYVLVSQTHRKIEKFVWHNSGFWTFQYTKEGDELIHITFINTDLYLDEVYSLRDMEFLKKLLPWCSS